ncbi:MAG: hypothetical protein JXA81_01885, partial [Sedimentisphaerales bacterium]|nr:hypothetical protein [Sedimentisphaerales bacterium]
MAEIKNPQILWTITLILIPVILCPITHGKVIYVNDDAAGANDGTSWINAYIYLQDALDDAKNSEKPVEIRVAQGIYKPDQGANLTPGDREATFRLINGVTLKGGYAGVNEVDRNLRDIQRFETTLSGDLNDDDDLTQFVDFARCWRRFSTLIEGCEKFDFNGNKLVDRRDSYVFLEDVAHMADNAYSVLTAYEVEETAVLDSFTITAGNACIFDLSSYHHVGAGIHIEMASPVIRNCMLKHNVVEACGGGLYSLHSSSTIAGCHFEHNLSIEDGGGLAHEHGSSTITGCTFIQNYAGDDGGGVYLSHEGNPTLENCHIADNVAGDDGGGIYCSKECIPLIIGNTVIGNVALNGGGIACKKYPAPVIVDNLFQANRARDDGGGMYLRYSVCQVRDNRIKENFAADDGGGIYLKTDDFRFGRVADSSFAGNHIVANTALDNGGGIYCQNVSPKVNNCVIALNFAEDGAGLWCRVMVDTDYAQYNPETELFSAPVLRNVTIYGNFATEIGGAICCRWGSWPDIVDSIIWANTTPSRNQIAVLDNSQLTISNSCIEDGWPGFGNINSHPFFFNPGGRYENGTVLDPNDDTLIEGDYHLYSNAGRWDPNSQSWVTDYTTSPCIDAGDPDSPVAHEPFPNGGIINMGAYGGTAEASKSPSGFHAKYGGGTGEPNNPYLIYTAEHFNTIGAEPNDWVKHFKLMEDTDLAAYADTEFNLIGKYVGWLDTNNIPFTGVFDGNNKTVYNFTWNSSGIGCIGLFRIVGEGATIKNLRMENVDIKAGVRVGALIGLNVNGTVERCSVTGSVTSDDEEVGGLIGRNTGKLDHCYFMGSVAGQYDVGGLVGAIGGSLYGCWFDGDVTGIDHVGGLVGEHLGSMSICFANGTVSGNNHVGGLVGYNDDGNISNSFSTAGVSGNDYVGGLVGSNHRDEGGGVLYHCYAA